MLNKGIFVSFEGLDGCGKSTQVSMLKDYLSTIKCKSFFIKGHPAYNGVKEQIINSFGYIDPIAMFLLTMAKHKVVEMEVQRRIDSPQVIVVDRYIDTSIAYTLANTDGNERVKGLIDSILPMFQLPTITFFINTPPEIALRRKRNLMFDQIELGNVKPLNISEEKAFLLNQSKAFDYYCKIAQNNPQRFIIVDGTQTREQMHEKVREEVARLL